MGTFKLRVLTSCPQASSGMNVDVRERHCASCSMTVHNLSAMTEKEARRLIAGSDGRVCVYYTARPDGTIVSRRRGRWIGRTVRALGTVVLAVAFWTGVVLLQRPWQALARKVFGVLPRVPPSAADAHISPGLPIHLLDLPQRPFFEKPRDVLQQFMGTGGIASPWDVSLIRLEQSARKPSGRKRK